MTGHAIAFLENPDPEELADNAVYENAFVFDLLRVGGVVGSSQIPIAVR